MVVITKDLYGNSSNRFKKIEIDNIYWNFQLNNVMSVFLLKIPVCIYLLESII